MSKINLDNIKITQDLLNDDVFYMSKVKKAENGLVDAVASRELTQREILTYTFQMAKSFCESNNGIYYIDNGTHRIEFKLVKSQK